MLKQRFLTAIVLAPLALFGVFGLPLEYFVYLLDVIMLLAAWEWANLSGFSEGKKRYGYVAVIAVIVAASHAFYSLLPVSEILLVSVLCWFVALYWVLKFPAGNGWRAEWQRALVGVVVLMPCWFAFVQLKAGESGELLILLLFLLVWGADVGAYFSGKKFGCNKLAPNVSPGKTREGVYGGLLACVVVALIFAIFEATSVGQAIVLLLLAIIVGCFSVLGDLFESMMKRYRGIKDSSQLLPGHGGILDRIDSLTSAAPLFVVGMQLVATI